MDVPAPLVFTMPLRKKRKSRTTAPAVIHFTQATNDKKQKQLCVFAECIYGGTIVGPIWSHSATSVRRALATLTERCDCGRRFHKQRQTEGARVLPAVHK